MQANTGELCGTIVGAPVDANHPGDRGNGDDVPPFLADHVGQKGLDGPIVGENVDGKRVLDHFVRQVQHRFAAHNACVIDKNVHGTYLLAYSGRHPVHCFTIAHVHGVALG